MGDDSNMYFFMILKMKTLLISVLLCTLLATCAFTAYSAFCGADREVSLPIIMYHSVLKHSRQQGEFVITPNTLESDLKYIKSHGYTTVFPSEVIEFVYNGNPMPGKPIMLTFDDGYLNNLVYVLPLLKEYNMKALVSVVGSYTSQASGDTDHNLNYSYFSWEDINEAVASGVIEIGNHSYNMHRQASRKGTMRKSGESPEDYRKALTKDLLRLQDDLEKHCGLRPEVFTYPFGQVSLSSTEIIRDLGFKASFDCYERINKITDSPECLYRLGRFNRSNDVSTEKFMKKILQ